jgi:hypothetical protein
MVGGNPTPDVLPDALTPCYYSFAGKAGQRMVLQAQAVAIAQGTPMDGSVTDTVITLYLPDKTTKWALNDDAWPRVSTDSTLYTELPMDGTYYFTIEDCNALAATNPSVSCYCIMQGMPAGCTGPGVSVFNYQVFVGDASKISFPESYGSAAMASTVKYTAVPMMAGSYLPSTLDGDIAAQTDVQKFSITPPTDVKPDPAARSRAYFFVQPYGSGDGTGTALDVVVTAKDMMGHVLAKADQGYYTNGDDPMNGPLQFQFPLDDQFGNKLGSMFDIEVSVSNKSPVKPMQAYYFIDHEVGPYYYGQAEKEGPAGMAMNDTVATAETLTVPPMQKGLYAIDGNLSSATDVDWYTMAVPAGSANVSMDCRAARDGSGLLGFTATLYKDAMGLNSLVAVGPEKTPNPTSDLSTLIAMPMGTPITGLTTMTLKISATGQDAANMGTFYNCSISIQ